MCVLVRYNGTYNSSIQVEEAKQPWISGWAELDKSLSWAKTSKPTSRDVFQKYNTYPVHVRLNA